LIAPTGLVRLHEAPKIRDEFGRVAIDAPVMGTAMFNTIVSRRSLRQYLRRVYWDDSLVTEQLVEIYYATSHQPNARFAPAAFLSGHLNIDVRRAVRRLMQPSLLVWGEESSLAPVEEARGFRALKSDFELAILSPAGDLPHDERSDDFNVILSAWLTRRSLSSELTRATPPGTRGGSPLTSRPS
jgi:pimeloyl-ACP methyl ester carboxylesterase